LAFGESEPCARRLTLLRVVKGTRKPTNAMKRPVLFAILGFIAGLLIAAACGTPSTGGCSPSNCSGCCDNTQSCVGGAARDGCGTGGTACQVCTGSQVCSASGTCVNPAGGDGGNQNPDSGNPGNDAGGGPVASASASPGTVQSGGQVTLMGSGTPSSGATITGYTWGQTAGTSVTLSSTTTQNPTFTAPTVASATTLTFSLVVADSTGAHSAPATTNVTVNPQGQGGNNIKYVFVIAMENSGSNEIYPPPLGTSTSTPYISGLMDGGGAGYATNYVDPGALSSLRVSLPHYVWMEAGTTKFADQTFTTDNNTVTASDSTASTMHLATQLNAAGVTWTAYEESMPAADTCPINTSGNFAARHDPFVWFQDISGNPPANNTAACASHHKNFTSLAGDLSANTVSKYNFITPNLCDDMHGGACLNGCILSETKACYSAGDSWLSTNLPPIINFVNANQGVIFVIWDEPETNTYQPFLVIGPNVKPGPSGSALGMGPKFTHSSLLRSEEEIFNLQVINTGQADSPSSSTDFSSFFQAGKFP
jgi:hypothetical protein